MPDGSLPPNLALAVGMAPSQVEFIEEHLKISVRGKNKARQERLQVAWDRLLLNLERSKNITDMVQRIVASKEDSDFVNRQRGAIAKTMSDVSKAKIKSMRDAKHVIEAADTEMQAHYKAATDYLASERASGRNMSSEDDIARAKTRGHAHLQDISRQFYAALQRVQDKIKEDSGVDNVSLGISGGFQKELSALRKRVDAVPQSGDGADLTIAHKLLTAIAKDAEQLLNGVDGDTSSTGVLGQVEDVSEDPRLGFFAESLKRKARLDGELAKLYPILEKMDRWDCANLPALRSELADIEKRMAAVYQPLKQIDVSKLHELEGQQTELTYETETLIRRGNAILEAEQELFEQPKRQLEKDLQQLEGRMAAVRSSVGKDQRAPIEAYLVALRTAITGLGGCNLDALKPAEAMMIEARQMVGNAENITVINKQIEALTSKAKAAAKAFAGKADPLATEAKELRTEVEKFEGSYKTLPINEAMKTAQDHLTMIEQEATRNQQLIDKRAAIQARIDAAELKLMEFNTLFRKVLAHGNVPESDYQGSLRTDLDTCDSWNKTKKEPAFYTTIETKLTRLEADLAANTATMNSFLGKDYVKLQMDTLSAQESFKATERDIAARLDGETDPDKLRALREELDAARSEYQEKSKELDLLNGFNKEIEAREAAEHQAELDRTQYLEKANAFMRAVTAELKDKNLPLKDYADEVTPQIKQVKSTYDLVKANKPGATGASGLSELSFVEKFVEGVRNRGKKTDKNDLGKISAQWRDEIGKLDRSKSALLSQVTDFEKAFADDDHAVSSAIESALTTIFARAGATSFGKAGDDLANGTDPQTVKAARELALAEVRRIRALMLDDKLFQKCVLNPFSVPMGSTAANRLDEIELNVLRGV